MSTVAVGPVMVASGCGGTGRELAAYVDLAGVWFVTRTITREPRTGSPVPRVWESPGGLLHDVGLDNPGLAVFLAEELPALVRAGVRVVVSLAATSLGEYGELARSVGRAPGVAGVEVNLSVPDSGPGLFDAREPFHAASAVAAVRRDLPGDLPVLAKLRTDVTRVAEAARAVHDAGAGCVVVGNALPAVLPDGRSAGLSGPAVAPLVQRCVQESRRSAPRVPVIASGGVWTVDDARRYLDLGACAVQVGTALLHDPTALGRITAGLERET